MKKVFLVLAISAAAVSTANAVPDLQLFIAGANYDHITDSWVTASNSFDLYVVSANSSREDVIVSLALGQMDDPGGVSANFGGTVISNTDWTYGYAPLDNYYDSWNGGLTDLPRHSVFPTNFVEMHTGNFGINDHVGDVMPDKYGDFWNPSTGNGYAGAWGEVRSFHVELGGIFSQIHFDAYTLNNDGTIREFAPFSHDASALSAVPEPATIFLLGAGLIGVGAASFRRKILSKS